MIEEFRHYIYPLTRWRRCALFRFYKNSTYLLLYVIIAKKSYGAWHFWIKNVKTSVIFESKKYLRSSMAAILLFLDNSISLENYSKTIIDKSNGPIYPENEFRLQVQFEIVTCLNKILCQYRLWMNYFALCVYTVTFTFKSFSFIFSWQIDHMTHNLWVIKYGSHIKWFIFYESYELLKPDSFSQLV